MKNMPWECATTLKWVSDLGAPLQPKICRFKGAAVPISEDHIRRADSKIGNGALEVIFNATLAESGGLNSVGSQVRFEKGPQYLLRASR
jgi:hypothetical protein